MSTRCPKSAYGNIVRYQLQDRNDAKNRKIRVAYLRYCKQKRLKRDLRDKQLDNLRTENLQNPEHVPELYETMGELAKHTYRSEIAQIKTNFLREVCIEVAVQVHNTDTYDEDIRAVARRILK